MSKSIRKEILIYRNILAVMLYYSSFNPLYLKVFQQKIIFFYKKIYFFVENGFFLLYNEIVNEL